MKTSNFVLLVATIVVVAVAIAAYNIGYEDGCDKIPKITEFQKRIGCTKIDGKLGPKWHNSETQSKWRQAWMKQNPGKYMY